MPKDIKKKSASHIYYGVDQSTGELRHISEVPSGEKCNCRCALCGKPFEARKGDIRRHHFAHVSNYKCMYAGEVAVYQAFADRLKSKPELLLPAIQLQFPAWSSSEMIQEKKIIQIASVTFECHELAYPPVLSITSKGSTLRILLEFGHYFDEQDVKQLAEEGNEQGYSTILYRMPSVDKENEFMPDKLDEIIATGKNSQWINSRLLEAWKDSYRKYAIEPQEHGQGYLCPISIGKYKGKYSARWVDCAYCRFNIAEPPLCLCLASEGIEHKEDLRKTAAERKARMNMLRQKNELEIQRQEQAERIRQQIRSTMVHRAEPQRASAVPNKPTTAQLEEAYKEVVGSFNPDSSEPTVDRYGRRWIKCQECGEIKQDTEMAYYGGPGGTNLGVCSTCSRKGRKM